jgi:hypothetical protein
MTYRNLLEVAMAVDARELIYLSSVGESHRLTPKQEITLYAWCDRLGTFTNYKHRVWFCLFVHEATK